MSTATSPMPTRAALSTPEVGALLGYSRSQAFRWLRSQGLTPIPGSGRAKPRYSTARVVAAINNTAPAPGG